MNSEFQLIPCSECGTTNRLALQQSGKEPVCGRCKARLIIQPWIVTDENFAHVVGQSSLPVLLDLWAPWCGPCRMMAPVIDQLAIELAGQVRVAKLNTEDNPMTGRRFGIQGIPTLLILNQGREIGRLVGAYPKAAILQKLREIL